MHAMNRFLIASLLLCSVATPVLSAPGIGPQPLVLTSAIPALRDTAFNGVMQLRVDARDQVHKILRVRQTIPVQDKQAMVLLYPQWETASHSATQTLTGLAGLTITASDTASNTAGSQRIGWRRDAVNPYAFHVDVPDGVRAIDVAFQFLSPTVGATLIGRDMLMVPWHKVALYPAGTFIRNIGVQAELTLAAGLQYATSLETVAVQKEAGSADSVITFERTTFEQLVDAPVYAGRYFARHELAPAGALPVRLNIVADDAAALVVPAPLLEKYRAMAALLPKLFRSQHYRHYDFLLSVSDVMPSGGGIEHQESSENNLPRDFFTRPDAQLPLADLLVHEYVHSWNGRAVQPADLWSPTLNDAVQGSLLWVYEGQSEFWGRMLAAQLGLRTAQQTRDALAVDAAQASARVGRQWKSLQDSTIDPLYMPARLMQWRDWQRREDYYGEGVLLWLDVDMLLRERTAGKRSLADFAARFFSVGGNGTVTHTYTFDDVCAALHAIVPYDWARYFRTRLDAHDDTHLLDGLARAGYRLVYTDEPTDYFVQNEAFNVGGIDLGYSLGLTVGKKGKVKTVAWEGPAFRAGIGIGATLTHVGPLAYTDDVLRQAIRTAARDRQPIELRFDADGAAQTARIAYDGGLRYPRLERIPGTVDRLDGLLTPMPHARAK